VGTVPSRRGGAGARRLSDRAHRGLYYARPSVEIAARLGVPWVEFPGIHLEFLARPVGFAAALRAVATQLHTATNAVPTQWNSEAITSL
jgi:hypothetical protein